MNRLLGLSAMTLLDVSNAVNGGEKAGKKSDQSRTSRRRRRGDLERPSGRKGKRDN